MSNEGPANEGFIRIMREVTGVGKNRDFAAEVLAAPLSTKAPDSRSALEAVRNLLSEHGLSGRLREQDVPLGYFEVMMRSMREADWERVRASRQPLLELISVVNHYQGDARLGSYRQYEKSAGAYGCAYGYMFRADRWNVPYDGLTPEKVAEVAARPLVYQTNFTTLLEIMSSGTVLSDRQLQEKNYVAQVYKQTHTNQGDRLVGLDAYVFAHHGNPEGKSYGSVEILFKPDRLFSGDGTFTTWDDYADVATEGEKGIDRYRRQIRTGIYSCRSRVQMEIGNTHGSGSHLPLPPSEVKCTTLAASEIDSIVFSSSEDLHAFEQAYPNSGYALVLKPDTSRIISGLGMEEKFGASFVAMMPSEYIINRAREHLANFSGVALEEEKKRIFGDSRVPDTLSISYTLSDAETRKQRVIESELNEGGIERRDRCDEAYRKNPEEFTEVYIVIASPREKEPYIRRETDLYLLRPSDSHFGYTKEHLIKWASFDFHYARIRVRRAEAESLVGIEPMRRPSEYSRFETYTIEEVGQVKVKRS